MHAKLPGEMSRQSPEHKPCKTPTRAPIRQVWTTKCLGLTGNMCSKYPEIADSRNPCCQCSTYALSCICSHATHARLWMLGTLCLKVRQPVSKSDSLFQRISQSVHAESCTACFWVANDQRCFAAFATQGSRCNNLTFCTPNMKVMLKV